jgi:hypothetical protein
VGGDASIFFHSSLAQVQAMNTDVDLALFSGLPWQLQAWQVHGALGPAHIGGAMGGTKVPSSVHGGDETQHENVKVPGEYFHDMHRVLWCKDLDVGMVTLFAL